MQNIYNIHYYYWYIYEKIKKCVWFNLSWSRDISCCNKPCKKKKKQIVMIQNSKLNDLIFVTLMNLLKNAKANENILYFLPYNMKNQQIINYS